MLAIAFAVAWGGYGIATWGHNLLKGYDITFLQWFDPVTVYEWPDTPPQIPPTQVNPSATAKKDPQPPALA
jgi:hypothetical protein